MIEIEFLNLPAQEQEVPSDEAAPKLSSIPQEAQMPPLVHPQDKNEVKLQFAEK